jgi:hypothetical protein
MDAETVSHKARRRVNMEASVYALVLNHLSVRPLTQVHDIYKLLYQSCMGLGHMVGDPKQARTRLEKEMDCIWPDLAPEHLFEDISLHHPLVRVNLRPFVKAGLTASILFTAMLETERVMTPSPSKLEEAWNIYCSLESRHALPQRRQGLEDFQKQLIASGYPVQHHSEIYRQNYYPAYRIVDRSIFFKILNGI